MLSIKTRWSRQPSHAVGVSPRYARAMQYAVIGGVARPLYDASNKNSSFGTTFAGTYATAIGPSGRVVSLDGSTYWTDDRYTAGPPISWLVVGKGTTSTTEYIVGGHGILSANNARLQFDTYQGTPRSIAVNTAGSASSATSPLAMANGEDFVAVFVVDSARVPHVYFKGIKTSGSANGGTVGAYTGARIGASPRLSTLNPYNGGIYAVCAWNRALLDEEAFSLLFKPWDVFAKPSVYVPAPVVASSLPTLSAPTYVPGSLTATGWRPRFTATY